MISFSRLASYVGAEPFRPFRITMTSGQTFEIRHPEMIEVGRTSMTHLHVPRGGTGASKKREDQVSLLLTESVEPLNATPTRRATVVSTGLQQSRKSYAFVSLGCPKNLVDSERMLGKLAQDGYALTPDADGADVVVVNTCGFIEPARQESLGVIREMLALKEQGRVGAVVVAGCLAERKKDDLLEEVPGGRSHRRRLRPRGDRRRSSTARRRRSATSSAVAVPPGPGAGARGHRPPAHHAAALRLPEDLRRLRPPLHLLRHPRHARQARHQADRGSGPRGPRTGRRRRARADPRRPGHDLLRPRPVRPGAAGRAAARAGQGRRPRVDPRPLRLPDALHRRADRDARRRRRRSSRTSTCRCSTSTTACCSGCSGASTARRPRTCSAGCGEAIPNLAMRTTFIVGFPGETDAEFEELQGVRARTAKFERLRRLPVLARAGHAGGEARRPPARGREAGPGGGGDGGAAGGRLRLGGGAGRPGAPGGHRRPRPGVRQPLPRPHLRRQPGHRLRASGSRARTCGRATSCR